MATKIQTPHFHALPPQPRHSITTHLPGWAMMLRFVDRDPEIFNSFKSMYPRMMLHRDIKELARNIMEKAGLQGKMCLLFSGPEAAQECVALATNASKTPKPLTPVTSDEITIRIFDIQTRLYAVIFPLPKTPNVMPFWMNTGTGISSRLAEESLKHIQLLHEVTTDAPTPAILDSQSHILLRERISSLLDRSPALSFPPRLRNVSPDDVYLYQTDFGPGLKQFEIGDSNDLSLFEKYLESETAEGRIVEVVWTEFSSNPILVCPDLRRLRELGDQYGFLLIVDDTIGSFCNIDVLSAGADIVVTSLTKSFSGYADVMAASAVLNPSSPRYTELKSLFAKNYRNEFFHLDADTLEKNSRDYLQRSAILNNNALTLVTYLQTLTTDPTSSVKAVYYPTTSPTHKNYTLCMRAPTPDFTPGYGCLFSVEFDTVESTIAFYDNLEVHQGPHLGAHLTLAMPYVRGLYAKELDSVAKFGLRETQIRISVGLERTEELVETFKVAVEAADQVKREVEGQGKFVALS